MRRHWNRPLISLAALAAIVGSMLALPTPATQAQTNTDPGESDPISNRPDALTQFPDDELLVVSDAPNDSRYGIQEFSPNPDYTLPAGPTSDPLKFPPTGSLNDPDGGYQRQFTTAKGRVVDPTRDVALALTKRAYDAGSSTMSWALQELSFAARHPSTPATVPALSWSTPVAMAQSMAANSPGAVAVGDLDRVPDSNGAFHDEAVVAYETSSGSNSQVQLQVVSYVAIAGQATVSASAAIGSFAYPCNISWLYNNSSYPGSSCPQRHPGVIDVTLGDFDGDGYRDIALLAHTYDSATSTIDLQTFWYSYCPAGADLAAGDARRAFCQSGSGPALQLRGSPSVYRAPDSGTNGGSFQSPAEITAGDWDGDGVEELAVVHLTNQRFTPGNGVAQDQYLGDATLGLLAWTAPQGARKMLQLVGSSIVSTVNAWYDGQGSTGPGSTPLTYYDLRVAAGLFKYSPELGYGLGRRQLAIAYAPLQSQSIYDSLSLTLELWDIASPNTPVKQPPAQWTAARYTSAQEQLCGVLNQSYAAFGLVAGNWAGVRLSPANALWGVGVSFEAADNIQAHMYRVDQNIDRGTAAGPLALAASQSVAKYGNGDACGSNGGRNELLAFDFDGDSLEFGAPMHTVLQNAHQFDYILQEPPQHIDYFPEGGLVNVSRRPDFDVSYSESKSQSFSAVTTNSSDWSIGTSIAANATVGTDTNAFNLFGADASVSVSNQFSYDYDNNQQRYVGSSDIYTSTLAARTAGGDAVQFSPKLIDIWRYPVYGTKSQDPSRPYTYYELYVPRGTDTQPQSMDGLLAQNVGYQPAHENGNLLSYPAVASGNTFQPADTGPWLLPASSTGTPGAVRCENDTRWCLKEPISKTTEGQIYFGGIANTVSLTIEHDDTQGNTREWTHKFSDSLDVEAAWKTSIIGTQATACVSVQVHGATSWGQSSTALVSSDETDNITINVPPNNDTSLPYHFNPVMYVTGDGAIKVAHGAGVDSGGSFWNNRYKRADPALNLPRKFNQPSTTPSDATNWELNKQWLDAQKVRGFWVRSAVLNPVSHTYDVVDGIKAGEQVLLDARVYNYSVGTPTGNVVVRFDLEPVDTRNNSIATGPRVTVATVNAGPIPFHGQTDSNNQVLPNYASVRLPLDTGKLVPASAASQTYRVWVVLDPQDPANAAQQTHGWRQPNVILTPTESLQAGTMVAIDLVDASGNSQTVSYTSQSTDDNIAAGLLNALTQNQMFKQFGAKASLQDAKTSTTSIAVRKAGVEPPSGDVYRAGLTEDAQALYFVPRLPANGVPVLTATNLEYGQNNEGWGLLTVNAPSMPGPMLGADDPCAASSGYSAERGPDIHLRRSSLTPMPADRRADGSKVVVRAGDRVPIRVSAYAGTDWAGFEHVTVFQGDPQQDGTVAGTALIRGIFKNGGGHDWFTWQAPSVPGTYELVALLQESSNDATPGNHTASVEIVVEPGPRLPYRFWLGAVSGRPQ